MKRPIVGKNNEPGSKNRKEGFTMKTLRTLMAFAFVATLLMLAAATESQAVAMGTPVTNKATVNYDVATVGQTPIESSPAGNTTPGVGSGTDTQFFVDNIVIVTVANAGNANVTVGDATDRVLTFTITNGGNADQRYILSATAGTNGADDVFDMNNVRIFVDTAGNVTGTYEPGIDTLWTQADDGEGDGTGAGVVTATGVMFAYIVADANPTNPVAPVNTETAIYWLNAQTADDAATTALGEDTDGDDQTDPYVEEARFADVAGPLAADTLNDGEHSAVGTYTVASAALTVQKTVVTIRDPYDLNVNPIAIPGAYVQYTIVVTNGSATPAELTTITDVLNASVQIDPDHNTSLGAPASVAGDSVHIVITNSTRAATDFYLTADNGDGDADGAGHSDPTSVGGTLTLTMTDFMPIEAGYATAGELLNTESVTITFVTIVQ